MEQQKLKYGHYYHICTHGVGGRNLFREPDNYGYFLHLFNKYLDPVAETFAWTLMPNHLHLLVRLKEVEEIDFKDLTGFENLSGLKPPHQHFSNLFNAYTKAFNKWNGVHGTLFERPFNRKRIDNIAYLRQVVLYIHNNPVHHGFCSHPLEYPWTSYLSCISLKPTKLKRDAVLGWFDNRANFKTRHGELIDFWELEEWLGL